jgi:hypothetical protein
MATRLSAKPLRDTKADAELFVDRAYELERVRKALGSDLNVLVLGGRRSGRTTFLKHLAYRLRTDWKEPHVFVEGGLSDDARAFLSLLRFRLLGDQHVSAREALARTARAIGGVVAGEPSVSLATPRHETEEMLSLYAATREAATEKPGCVVLVDEISSPELTHAIFGRFRDETWSLPLRWVVAGDVDHRGTYLTPPADAFFEVVVELAPLSDEAAQELLRRRAGDDGISPDYLEAAVKMGEGNPQRLLSAARSLLIDGVGVDELAAMREWRASRLAALGPAAHRLLEELDASGPASASDGELLARLDWTRGRAAQVFGQLEKAGLVRSSSQRSATGGPDRKVFEPVGTSWPTS